MYAYLFGKKKKRIFIIETYMDNLTMQLIIFFVKHMAS